MMLLAAKQGLEVEKK